MSARRDRRRRLAVALCLAAASLVAASPLPAAEDPVRAALLPAGFDGPARVRVAVRLTIDPGWYIYWTNPGDAGLPSRIRWSLPPGVALRNVEWPPPERFGLDSASLGYAGEVVVIATLESRPGAAARSTIDLAARVEWAACAEVCVAGRSDLRATVRAGDGGGRPRPAMPVRSPTAHDWRPEAVALPGSVELRLTPPPSEGVTGIDFFPMEGGVFHHRPPALERHGGKVTIRLLLASGRTAEPRAVRGVLTWVDRAGRRSATTIAARVTTPDDERAVSRTPLRETGVLVIR
ncbi:MAG TPA: protein-disulfide reductase DsbD domain-containing protein [Gemmatimonadaceae bacterium]|nr:protein-disulfide reductase DsbD domain-containing protein [Gemmatimonadaceae bacterium]